MTDAAKLVIVLEAQSKKMQNQLVQVSKQIDRFSSQTERRFAQMQRNSAASFDKLGSQLRGSMAGLSSVLAPLIGAVGVREVIGYADAWTEAGNKIAAAAQASGMLARPLEDIKDAANGARSDLQSYVDLYAKLLRISPSLAASEEDVARATDIVAKSMKAGGASASEVSAGILQLGQALGAGALQGDELRSILENAPLLAQAIADEFGVAVGQLKKLGAEGKLTSSKVFQGILKGGAEIEKTFNKTQSTIGDAFSRINNEFTAYIGTAGQANGATQGLIDALNYLAANFKDVADVVVQFALLLAGALAGKAIAGVVIGIGQAIGALGAFMVALRGGTIAAGAFTAALGPIGIIAGVAAAAIFLLQQGQEEATRAAEEHSAAMKTIDEAIGLAAGASAEYQKTLRNQVAVQVEAARAALAEADAQTTLARARLAASTIDVFGLQFKNPFDAKAADDALARSVVLDKQLQEMETRLAAVDATIAGTPGTTTPPPPAGTDGSPYDKALQSIKDRTDALLAETSAQATLNPYIEDYGYALEKAKAKQDLLKAAEEAKIAKTPELLAAIDAAAEGYARASVEAQRLAESNDKALDSMRGWFDSGRDALKGFITDLQEGKTAAEALGGVFDKLANKLLDMGLDSLFGGGGKDFGIIGSLFGFAGGGVAANGRPQPMKTFAGGGVSRSASIFGEAGPEAAVPLPDGRRIPVDLRMPAASSGGGGALQVTVSVGVQNGNLVPLIAQVSGEVAGRQIDQRVPTIVKQVAPGAVRIANGNRTG